MKSTLKLMLLIPVLCSPLAMADDRCDNFIDRIVRNDERGVDYLDEADEYFYNNEFKSALTYYNKAEASLGKNVEIFAYDPIYGQNALVDRCFDFRANPERTAKSQHRRSLCGRELSAGNILIKSLIPNYRTLSRDLLASQNDLLMKHYNNAKKTCHKERQPEVGDLKRWYHTFHGEILTRDNGTGLSLSELKEKATTLVQELKTLAWESRKSTTIVNSCHIEFYQRWDSNHFYVEIDMSEGEVKMDLSTSDNSILVNYRPGKIDTDKFITRLTYAETGEEMIFQPRENGVLHWDFVQPVKAKEKLEELNETCGAIAKLK